METTTPTNRQRIKPAMSGYAPVNGIEVYYEIYGEGQPVMLLHGAYMTIDMNWGEIIPELSKKRKVIAIELQGHGHTPFSDRPLSRAMLAKDVAAIMDYLEIEHCDIVGYSFGGSVAYQFAIQSPERLRKMVIISSTYKSDGWMEEVNSRFKDRKPEMFTNSPLHTAYDAVASDKANWPKFLAQMFALSGQPYNMGAENIAAIKSPVLLIAGDNDGLDKIELIKTCQLLGGAVCADFGAIARSQLAIVPRQGHWSLMQQTQTILGYLDSFLQA